MPLAIGGLLVVTLVVQLARPASAPTAQRAEPPWRPASAGSLAGAPDYPGILSRPLFNPARGAAGAAGADQAASANLGDYSLAGVAIVRGRGVAVLRGPAGEAVSLREGDALLGWRLAAISHDGIVLQQGDVRRVVRAGAAAAPKIAAP